MEIDEKRGRRVMKPIKNLGKFYDVVLKKEAN